MVTFYLEGRVWKNDSRPTTAPESEGGVMGDVVCQRRPTPSTAT